MLLLILFYASKFLMNYLIPPLKTLCKNSGTDMRHKTNVSNDEFLIQKIHDDMTKKKILFLLQNDDSIFNKMGLLKKNTIKKTSIINGGLLKDFELDIHCD